MNITIAIDSTLITATIGFGLLALFLYGLYRLVE